MCRSYTGGPWETCLAGELHGWNGMRRGRGMATRTTSGEAVQFGGPKRVRRTYEGELRHKGLYKAEGVA